MCDDEIGIALVGMLHEGKIKVLIDGHWITGMDAMQYGYKELMSDENEWGLT